MPLNNYWIFPVYFILLYIGVHNAWVLAKEIPESVGADIFDCSGLDIICVHKDLGMFVSFNQINSIELFPKMSSWPIKAWFFLCKVWSKKSPRTFLDSAPHLSIYVYFDELKFAVKQTWSEKYVAICYKVIIPFQWLKYFGSCRWIFMLAVCFFMKLLAGMFTSLLLVFWPSQLSTLFWVN